MTLRVTGEPKDYPLGVYVEIVASAQLHLDGTVFLTIRTIRNVDAQVKYAIETWEEQCKQWQDDNMDNLTRLPHIGKVDRVVSWPGRLRDYERGHAHEQALNGARSDALKCGISAFVTDDKGGHTRNYMRP